MKIIDETKRTAPLYDFTADDKIHHTLWRIEDPQITTREQAAIGAGIQTHVKPNQIHMTTIASYDDGGGDGDITIMLTTPWQWGSTYLRFAVFGRAAWLVGDDNVYTLDITNNKILF